MMLTGSSRNLHFLNHSSASALNLNASLLLLIGTYSSIHYRQEYQIKKTKIEVLYLSCVNDIGFKH